MSRRTRLALAALFALTVSNPASSQVTSSPNSPTPPYLLAQQDAATAGAASPADSSAPAGDEVAKLQAQNAALKKEVADAAHTIAQLQRQLQLAQAGSAPHAAATTAPDSAAADDNASTNAAPAGPQRALPLDATNANVTAAEPSADAGPSRSYTVVKGDSLWKIAHKMYPHDTLNGEDKIREANKNVFNGKFLQPGQVLIIPQ